MLYAIIGQDIENSLEKRLAARPEHLARLEQLQTQNRLFTAGPFPNTDSDTGFSGSLIVAEFDSLQDAIDWADEDPYKLQGIYQHVTIKPYKKVF